MYALLEVRWGLPRCRMTVTDASGEVLWRETFWSVRKGRREVERLTTIVQALEYTAVARTSEIADLRARLVEQGFEVTFVTRTNRWKVTAQDGRKAQISGNPNNGRAYLNAVSRLRKIGYAGK